MDEGAERQLNIHMEPQHLAGVYANFANITFSDYEFTLTFARIDHEVEDGDVPGVVVARVNMSQQFAQELLAALQDAYSKYTTVKGIQDLPETDDSTTSAPRSRQRSRHRDALHQRRVVLEPEVVPERRVRLLEARLLEGLEELASPTPDLRRVQRAPVRLRLVAARDDVLERRRQRARARVSTSIAYGRFSGRPSPPRRRSREREQPERRQHDERAPADRLQDVPAPHVPELVRDHDVLLATRERPSSSVSQSTTCVDGPNPAVKAFAWSVHDETSCTPTGVPATPSTRSSRCASAPQRRVAQRMGAAPTR